MTTDKRPRNIYAFEFSDKSVYVGLSVNVRRRFKDHHREGAIRGKLRNCSYQFVVFNGDYTKKQAKVAEGEYLEMYLEEGWRKLNRYKTGSLGSPIKKITDEKILETAKKCKTYGEFFRNHYSLYSTCLQRGIIDQVRKILPSERIFKNTITKDQCLKIAKKYKTRTGLRKSHPKIYDKIKRESWCSECFSHMPLSKRKKNRLWPKYKVKKFARSCKTYSEFCKNHGAYAAALKAGYSDEIYKMFTPAQKPSGYWTDDKLAKVAKRYKYKRSFKEKNPTARSIIYQRGLHHFMDHMIDMEHAYLYTKEDILRSARKCKTRTEFYRRFQWFYKRAKEGGFFEDCCRHMPEHVRGKNRKYTLKMIQAEAKKYKTRTKFFKGSKDYYCAAQRFGLLDKVCKHMPKRVRRNES